MQYNPRQHQYTSSLNDEIGGYGGYEEQVAGTPGNHRPARHLRNTEQAVIAERLARQQAIDEARARQQEKLANARQNRTTRNPASARRRAYTPTNRAYREDEDDIDGNGDVLPSQGVARSSIRHTLPGQYVQGNTQWNVKQASPPGTKEQSPIPRRSSREAYREEAGEEEDQDFEEDERETERRRKRRNVHIHWFVFAGIALLLMLAGWIALNDLGVWWQNHQDDVTYGMPRTFQTDAVVGHNDSNSSPSHFIALNLRGQIYVLELPGGDATKARGYFITSEAGNDANPPVKIAFQDIGHSGRLDMVVTIGDPPNPLIVFLFNNGSQFAAKSH